MQLLTTVYQVMTSLPSVWQLLLPSTCRAKKRYRLNSDSGIEDLHGGLRSTRLYLSYTLIHFYPSCFEAVSVELPAIAPTFFLVVTEGTTALQPEDNLTPAVARTMRPRYVAEGMRATPGLKSLLGLVSSLERCGSALGM